MLHLDAHHTNRSPFRGPITARVAWTFDTGGPVQAAATELEDGTIIVASLGGKLFALSPAGAPRFTVDLGDRVYATPLLLDGRIYVGSDAHRFFAADRQGAVRFQLQTDSDVDTSAVAAPWGGVLFASGKMVYACKPDGTVLWRVQAKRKCYSSPAVSDDGTTYVGSQDDNVYAIDRDGALRWRTNVGADVDSAPALLDDGTVVVGTDRGQVVAIEPLRGDIRWTTDVGGYVRGALSVTRDGSVLVGTYGPTPRVVALSPQDGEARTVFAIPSAVGTEVGIHGAPVQDANGRLFFGAQDDFIYALEADGSLLWKVRTSGDVDAPVVITTQGLLVVGSDDGKIYAIGGT
jgi:outer membrane protein assembly factor BamB